MTPPVLEGVVGHEEPLTIGFVLERMRTVNARSEVVSLTDAGIRRASFAEVAARTDRLAGALLALGIREGDRVGTLCWNTQEHLEAYYAIPSIGAVLHTVNLRLAPEQLEYVITHGGDRVLIVDESLIPILAPVAARLTGLEHIVVVGDADASSLGREVLRYEALLDAAVPVTSYPPVDDRAAAALCYTSGTTGNPKGVLYSHRSTVLHSMAAGMVDTLAVSGADRVLPIVPMFHAGAWGLPYTCGLVGASLILAGRFTGAEPLTRLIASERVTLAAAVPTIWADVLRHVQAHDVDLSSLRSVPCGGAAIPRSLMEGFEQACGVEVVQAWGMTETSPLGAVCRAPAGLAGEERWAYKAQQGRIVPGVRARITGEDGSELPWDGQATGELEVRGPWVATGYYRDPEGSVDRFHDGWLRTGDIAAIDQDGTMRITDRAKDVIKSGGEWISSVDLENALMAHPAVREAAAVAIPDERWTERPLACVVLEPGAPADVPALQAHLGEHVAKWWIPERFAFIDEVPKTSVGKFDKKRLRQAYADGELVAAVPAEAGA
jgi:fatty-acyl-CoA synthase